MASAPKPPLEDPTSMPEIFASECANVAFVHGNTVVTLANVRLEETDAPETTKLRRFVVGRFALSNQAARQFLAQLQRVMAQVESSKASQPS